MAKNSKKKKKGTGRGSIAIIVSLLLIVMSYQCVKLYNKNQDYIAKEEQLRQELEAETARHDELENYEQNLDSDEYTEKEAHTKLGMLYENETVYREE